MKDEKAVDPNRLLDLSNYFMAFNAFTKWSEETERTPDSFDKRGLMFARRYLPMLSEGVEQHIAPIVEQPSAQRLKPFYRRFDRSGTPTDKVRFRVEFLEQLFMWFRAHQADLRTTFSGKGRRSAMALLKMSQEDDPVSIVASAAALPTVSGLQGPRNWIKKAAEIMGAGLNDAEEAISDVESLANVASEIKDLEAQIAGAEPNSEKLAELTAKKEELLEQMSKVASGDKGVLQAAAAAAFKPHKGHQTDTGAKLSLNSQQEAAMMASGRKVVAAGAGSGKTRVLAGEVAYRINEMGYDATSICAVSFTGKSSKELIKRAGDYGAVIDGAAALGFGTTHKLAGRTILGQYAKGSKRPNYISKDEQWKVTTLVTLAVKQVSMRGGEGMKAPEPRNLFTGKPSDIPDSTTEQDPSFDTGLSPEALELLEALEAGIEKYGRGYSSYYQNATSFMKDVKRKVENGMDPDDLSDRQKNWLNKILASLPNTQTRVAELGEVPDVDTGSRKRKKRTKLTDHYYYKNSANEWFNLNHKWDGDGSKSGKEGQQFSAAAVRQKISIWKGMGASPEEVWYAAGPLEGAEPYTPEAAAYAAYEWLKGSKGEPDFRNHGDLDDLLIDATRALINDKRARGALQKRFKVILVDEAQDLNRTQHTLFGLLAGALDPETLKPTDKMTADTFGFIGDDKQAIYEFRGAEPDEFINKSDLGPAKGDFETLLLDTNYRSGQAIVEAANNLIKHNSKQIPMTCKANYEAKGDGSITAESFGSPAHAADYVAGYIEDFAEANATADKKYGNFGVAVRSNAEAMHYALGMVKKGIPFVSKVNPFKSPPVKAMLGWMTIVNGSSDPAELKKALKECVRFPKSFLGNAFTNRLEKQSDPLDWLLNIDPYEEFVGNYAKNVEAFIANIETCRMQGLKFDDRVDPKAAYDRLLVDLVNANGDNFFDGIVENIKANNGKMAELAAESENNIPTDDQIKDAAGEELVLLSSLMDSRDSLEDVMDYVDELKAVNDKVASSEDKDAVIINTMHSWKGLEVPKLFMPLVRGKFPRVRLAKSPGGAMECLPPEKDDPALASERRLAYVAITRAEDSCVMMDIANPSDAFADCPPSQFISEACVRFAADPEQGSKLGSEEDPMLSAWDDEGFDYEWYRNLSQEEIEAEEEQARMLHEMGKTALQFDQGLNVQDDLLSQWEKQHGDK